MSGWGHQHNLLFIASVLQILKHSARSMGDSETVDILQITACTQKFSVVIVEYLCLSSRSSVIEKRMRTKWEVMSSDFRDMESHFMLLFPSA